MGLVDSGVNNPYLDSGPSIALAADSVPEDRRPDKRGGPVHLQVEEVVWDHKVGSGSVEQVIHVMTIELYCDSVKDDRVLIDDLDLRSVVLEPALCESSTISQVRRVGLGSG